MNRRVLGPKNIPLENHIKMELNTKQLPIGTVSNAENDDSTSENSPLGSQELEIKVEESCKIEENIVIENQNVEVRPKVIEFMKGKKLIRIAAGYDDGQTGPYICKICGKSFDKRKLHDSHLNVHSLLKRHKCKVCKNEFFRKQELLEHECKSENVKSNNDNDLLRKLLHDLYGINQNSLETRKSRNSVRKEIKPKTKTEVGKIEDRRKNTLKGLKTVLCDVCGLSISRGSFPQHQRSHNGIKPPRPKQAWKSKKRYLCEICGLRVTCSGCFCHKEIHTVKQYNCEVCGSSFALKNDFKRHQFMHTGIKPFQCDECGKCFAKKDYLTLHNRTHTGEKPLKCEFCGKGFARLASLHIHKRNHIGKPHGCVECGKCFTHLEDLVDHKRVHTIPRPFECDICKKRFKIKYYLKLHIFERHLQKKHFVCEVCRKSFDDIDSLISHEQLHTVGRPHPCKICNRKFRNIDNLTKHEQEHVIEKSEIEVKCELIEFN